MEKNKPEIINAFQKHWESFTRFINIYLKNNTKIDEEDKVNLKKIANQLDKIGNKAFVLDKYQLKGLINYNENSIQYFFSIPIISDYISDYEKNILQINLRKILNKMDKGDLTREEIQSFAPLIKLLEKYMKIAKPHTFIATFLPPIKYKDLRTK